MSDIKTITVNGTQYDIKDATARADCSDLKSAIGELVTITDEAIIDGYSPLNASNTVMANSPFVYADEVQAKAGSVVNKIKLNATAAGTVSLGVIKKTDCVYGATVDRTKAVVKATAVVKTGENTTAIDTPFSVAEDEFLFVGMPSDTAVWRFGGNGEDQSFYYSSGGIWNTSGSSVGVTFYTTVIAITDYLGDIEKKTDIVTDTLYDNDALYDSYSPDNERSSSMSYAPFMVDQSAAGYITSIKVDIRGAGTVSIGTIKKTYVVDGQSLDTSKIVIHEVAEFLTTGVQTYNFSEYMFVGHDDLLVFGISTDTAIFRYGSHGTDTTFYYISGDHVTFNTSAGLGITVYGYAIKESGSIYNGKSLSILGDSISTFAGYIPSGNATYYPAGTVRMVSDTWWYKLYTALGMTLDTNNSWSGSRVTTTDGETSAGCMTRCQNLGDPDVIIVWMGINDFNNEVPVGTYDGTTALPSGTTTFREAYAVMLNKILTAYKTAEVWVCTLPQCERNASTGFPEINNDGVSLLEYNRAIRELADAFGVKVLDHNKCGLTYQNMSVYNPDELHPNKYGHTLVANNDIGQMAAAVQHRYPTAEE